MLFRRTIFYNRKYDNLDDDSLRFALLHEEGHHRGRQYITLILIIDIAVIVSSILLVIWKANSARDMIEPIVWGLLPIYIWLLLASLKVFNKYIHEDEFEADAFAARILRDSYGIGKPSEIVDRTLKALAPKEKHDSSFWYIFWMFSAHSILSSPAAYKIPYNLLFRRGK
ncbi:MAG: M48 family metalloprotease, partial [Methanomassiliicoccales archaeon]|nr:M48 family metalloprotease [Methanomassiliicoccales archaeon]